MNKNHAQMPKPSGSVFNVFSPPNPPTPSPESGKQDWVGFVSGSRVCISLGTRGGKWMYVEVISTMEERGMREGMMDPQGAGP